MTIEIKQVDREAAAEFELMIGRINERDADNIRAGEWNITKDIQWFGRLRQKTQNDRISELERERDTAKETIDAIEQALMRGDDAEAVGLICLFQEGAPKSRLASYDALVEALCYCRAALDSEIASLLDSVCLKDETGTPIRATAEEGCLPDLERMEHASRAAADALKKVGR